MEGLGNRIAVVHFLNKRELCMASKNPQIIGLSNIDAALRHS